MNTKHVALALMDRSAATLPFIGSHHVPLGSVWVSCDVKWWNSVLLVGSGLSLKLNRFETFQIAPILNLILWPTLYYELLPAQPHWLAPMKVTQDIGHVQTGNNICRVQIEKTKQFYFVASTVSALKKVSRRTSAVHPLPVESSSPLSVSADQTYKDKQ